VFGDPRLAPYRLAQQAFKAVVLNAYHGHCAITSTKIRPVLQAAHIRPVTVGGENRVGNGLLLRSDVHTMFDRGYLGVDPSYRLRVSPRLRDEFGNGGQFYAQAGRVIALPDRRIDRPQREFLEWHLGMVFKACLCLGKRSTVPLDTQGMKHVIDARYRSFIEARYCERGFRSREEGRT
jgi:putative restriction endonuclease